MASKETLHHGRRLIPRLKPRGVSKDASSYFGSHPSWEYDGVNGTGAQTSDLGQCTGSLAEVSATRVACGSEESLLDMAVERRKVASLEDKCGAWHKRVEYKNRYKFLIDIICADVGERGNSLYKRGQGVPRFRCFFCKGPHWAMNCLLRVDLFDQEVETKTKEGDQATNVTSA